MKKHLWLVGAVTTLALAAVAWAGQNVSTTPLTWHDIRQGRLYDTLVIDSGGATWITDADLIQPEQYWLDGVLKVIDVTSGLTDTTRDITGFYASQDSIAFSVTAGDTLVPGDTVEVSVLLPIMISFPVPTEWSLDSASVDTSEIYYMTPGAAITSTHLIEIGDGQDSADTKIVLQIAIAGTMPNGQVEWFRNDSINTYTTQDTVQYKAWGAKQATMFRFILDPTDAPFSASHSGVHYGRVLVDK